MTDAYENENLQTDEGQPVENVGQDEGQSTEQSSGKNWEEQAKYFQSEKDKLAGENQNLKQYEAIGNLLRSRPDIANTVAAMVNGGGPQPVGPQKIELGKDEFDPWEAYNDPKSKSYKFRQQELQEGIQEAVGQRMAGVQRQQGMQNLENQLSKQGLNDEQVKSFMDFASKNPAEYGIEGAVKMWQAVMGDTPEVKQPNALDNVRQTQEAPTPGGILQGEQPIAKNEKEAAWDSIMNSGNRSNVL